MATNDQDPSSPVATYPSAYQAPLGVSSGSGERPTNVLAIIALIAAFVAPLAGIIVGHIALSQIKKTGEGGHGLALWGTILGYAFMAFYIFVVLFAIFVPILLADIANVSTNQ